jgi:hypothetical protein
MTFCCPPPPPTSPPPLHTQALLEEHKEDVKKVAERLLALETISQHDIKELVGARPFASDVRATRRRARRQALLLVPDSGPPVLLAVVVELAVLVTALLLTEPHQRLREQWLV